MVRGRVWLVAVALSGPLAAAQDVPDVRAEAAPPPGPAAPTRDLFDVVRDLRHKPPAPAPGPEDYKKRMVALAPVLGYAPTSGVGVGVAGNAAFYRGHPGTTNISSMVASVMATSKKQVLVNAKVSLSTAENRWLLLGDNRLYWTSQKTYGLGGRTLESDAVDQKQDYFRIYETLARRISRNAYLGAGLFYSNHRDVRPADEAASAAWPDSPYATYSSERGFDPESQTSAGISFRLLLDSRDGSINPSRGWYLSASYMTFFEGLLGGESDWQQVSAELRSYARLSADARHRLGVWVSGDFVVGGTAPYLDLPATAMDTYGRAGRGYPQGRFRGEDLLYAEAEYRWTVTDDGLLGLVAFVNTQTLSAGTDERLFDSFATGAGVGVRLMLNKRSRTNLCFDVGIGKGGSSAVYFAVQEAF